MIKSETNQGLQFSPDMPEAAVRALLSRGKRRNYRKNQMVISVGDDFKNLFIVEAGRFSISIIDRHGRTSIYGYVGPGSTWGLMATLTENPASFFFEAVEDSVVTCVSRKMLWSLIDSDPVVRRGVILSLGWSVSKAVAFGHQERTLPLRSRLANFLIERANEHWTVELSQSILARNLGVSRYAVGTHLQELRSRSLIEIQYGRILILLPDELKKVGTLR